ncbi:putative nuclease HARBI1 [Lucilia cuprina]|nr:putative nuclease HARBI1 [Lucilia cuprina]
MPRAFILCYLQNERHKLYREVVRRRILRDASNPMEMPESSFIGLYRLNKSAFSMILNQIAPLIKNTTIPPTIQLAATLRFFAVGGFQGVIANAMNISIGRSTMCKVLWNVANILESHICQAWINMEMDDDEINASKTYFNEKYGIQGVIGCVDGTHVRMRKPETDESLYYNRKGYFSINVMIVSQMFSLKIQFYICFIIKVCDYKMRILAVDGCRPGSCHDAFIWNLSDARNFFEENNHNGWLLADSAYMLQSFVMTPYRNPQFGSVEHLYNQRHSSARNIVERTIGNLKSRFRCLQNAMLPYSPAKVVKIVNICCALHNICKSYRVDFDESPIVENEDVENSDEEHEEINSNNEAAIIRNNIAQSLIQN